MFKRTINYTFALCLILLTGANAVVWKDGEFLLWSYGNKYISPEDFCFALRYENEKIGSPNCYEAGDYERDTTISLYAKWLNTNLNSSLETVDLRPRNQHVIDKLFSLKDRSLIFSTVKEGNVWFLLFDETSQEPQRIAKFSINEDSAAVAKKIASDWFGGTPQVRLSEAERIKKQKEPDSYYAEEPMYDVWLGIGMGYNRAKVPLTPYSWYKNTLNSRIKNYRNVRDSSSAWDFLDDSTPIYSAYIGGSLYDFIGLELGLRRSNHKAKIDNTNINEQGEKVYDELSHWSFNRYEFMLSLMFMKVFNVHRNIEIEPHVSAGVLYSFFTEDIALKKGDFTSGAGSDDFKNRFKFESYYRGVILTFGLRAAFFKNYALDLQAGIANRGTSMVTQEIIGSSTTDVFIAAGLEYHFRWR